MTLDKLEAAPSEAALVERALELLAEHHFWAGVVFLSPKDSPNPKQLPGPGHMRIKICVDIDNVIRTNKIRDRSCWSMQQCTCSVAVHPVPASTYSRFPTCAMWMMCGMQ